MKPNYPPTHPPTGEIIVGIQGWEEKRRWMTILGADFQDLAPATIFDKIMKKVGCGGWVGGWVGDGGGRRDGLSLRLSVRLCILPLDTLPPTHPPTHPPTQEIPAEIVYEDSKVLAFRDISPQAPTHILLIPKRRQGLTQLRKATDEQKGVLGTSSFLSSSSSSSPSFPLLFLFLSFIHPSTHLSTHSNRLPSRRRGSCRQAGEAGGLPCRHQRWGECGTISLPPPPPHPGGPALDLAAWVEREGVGRWVDGWREEEEEARQGEGGE